jgi:hypothetical protein
MSKKSSKTTKSSKSFGTKSIPAGSERAREITRFIDERRARSANFTGRFITVHARRQPKPR